MAMCGNVTHEPAPQQVPLLPDSWPVLDVDVNYKCHQMCYNASPSSKFQNSSVYLSELFSVFSSALLYWRSHAATVTHKREAMRQIMAIIPDVRRLW